MGDHAGGLTRPHSPYRAEFSLDGAGGIWREGGEGSLLQRWSDLVAEAEGSPS